MADPQNPLEGLKKATSIKADPYAQWFTDHPVLGGLADLVAPGVDPHREVGPVDLLAVGAPLAGAAMKGLKAYREIGHGASSAVKDLYGIAPEPTRREFFTRFTSKPMQRSVGYLKQASPDLFDAEQQILANHGLVERTSAPVFDGRIISARTGQGRDIFTNWKSTAKWDKAINDMLANGTRDPFEEIYWNAGEKALETNPTAKAIMNKRNLDLDTRLGWVSKNKPKEVEETSKAVEAISNLLKRFGAPGVPK